LDDATAAAAVPWFPGSECRTWLFSSDEMNRSTPPTIPSEMQATMRRNAMNWNESKAKLK
jgi:hypothetical protein